ncbi:MAG: hypothetical protein J2P37_08715, partial [Ktedonobacteraceae bacterium]|nr:hypothetical protein [Ktedonobacteraceae bacterium]
AGGPLLFRSATLLLQLRLRRQPSGEAAALLHLPPCALHLKLTEQLFFSLRKSRSAFFLDSRAMHHYSKQQSRLQDSARQIAKTWGFTSWSRYGMI